MSLTLFYKPHTRAGRVRWLLEELAVPYELVRVDAAADGAAPEAAAFRAASPLGKVPAMLIDGAPLIESAAMLIYLADRFADRGLAPAPDAPERARYLQWHVFAPATLEPPLLELWKELPDDAKAAARARTIDALRVVADALADGREYLCGAFSAADCAIGQVTGWARSAQVLGDFPALREYGRRIAARPAYQRSRAD